jgi:hypothetical protein
MNVFKSLLTAVAFAVAVIVSLAADEPMPGPGTWFGYADGVEYQSTISRDAVVSSPAWSPGAPFPLPIERALEVARAELTKLVKKPDEWYHTSISLKRLRGSKPEHWFFVIGFRQEFRRDQISASFRGGMVDILVDFSGRPGTIKPKERE